MEVVETTPKNQCDESLDLAVKPLDSALGFTQHDETDRNDVAEPSLTITVDNADVSRRDTPDGNAEGWDMHRFIQTWAIDPELEKSLPYLARAKRAPGESAAEKFLRITQLKLPELPGENISTESGIACSDDFSQEQQLSKDTKDKYFSATAKTECYAIFRKLAKQRYLPNSNISQHIAQRHEEPTPDEGMSDDGSTEITKDHDSKTGLFARQFTARHKFSSLCLEKNLPPCLRLIIRNYFSPEINLSHMSIGDDFACILAACLVDLPLVTSLNVRNNRLKDEGLQSIIDVVVSKKDLYHLDLSENKVDGEASASLAAYLGSPLCALQTLKLSHADVDDGELAAFTQALHINKSLRSLDLSHNLIGTSESLNVVRPSIVTGGEALATMLAENYTLVSLDLSWNYIRLGSAVEIGRSLAYNNGLRELNLAYNAFGDTGSQAVGEALLSNLCLEKLIMNNNNIPTRAALALASGIKLSAKLVYIDLSGNPLGQAGGRALLHAVASCTERQVHVLMEGCNFEALDTEAFDPTESTGSYDLNMAVPYERAVALELLHLANTRQGCKFLSIVHTSTETKATRTIKVELRDISDHSTQRRLLKTAGILTQSEYNEEKMKSIKMDRDSLEDLFHDLDEDDSGCIDKAELRRGLQSLGLDVRDDQIPRFIAQYDLDSSGTIELEEFIELISSLNLESGTIVRECVDLETNRRFDIPTEGRLRIDFVDFHVSTDDDSAHSQTGVERLIENISTSTNKTQMLGMAKSGLYFKMSEAQRLLESVSDVYDPVQAVTLLLPNMVDSKNAYRLIEHNLTFGQRVRVQHIMGYALQPILGLSTGHYKLDLSNEFDRMTLKKLVENSNRTAFLRKKENKKDTSQHCNFQGFRNETLHGKSIEIEPKLLDGLTKFGMIEFDYVQFGRRPGRPISKKRFDQVLYECQFHRMPRAMGLRSEEALKQNKVPVLKKQGTSRRKSASGPIRRRQSTVAFPKVLRHTKGIFEELDKIKSIKNYCVYQDGLKCSLELEPVDPVDAVFNSMKNEGSSDSSTPSTVSPLTSLSTESKSLTPNVSVPRPRSRLTTDRNDISRDGKEVCTARRLLFNLQWILATRWISSHQALTILSKWPHEFHETRIEAVCILFDRIVDLWNFNAILSALTDFEAGQCFYRFGWLNIWTPLMPDNYYELSMNQYEEREVAKALVRLAIDEPGENWQGETFGWTREEKIPGWELNVSWLKDGGFPEKGYLCLEYYSGSDKGCGPVWPSRKDLALNTLAELPPDKDVEEALVAHVDALGMSKK